MGILNITKDSFYDGGKYCSVEKAVERALQMIAQGAHIIDIGAESTHPDSRRISAKEEIDLLAPVLKALKSKGVFVSIDTYKPEVIAYCLSVGADMINDVTGLAHPDSMRAVAKYKTPVVIMHSRGKNAYAGKEEGIFETIIPEIKRFFETRMTTMKNVGIKEENIILDPGMGFFLGSNPEPSLKVLADFAEIASWGYKTLISPGNKSFIGSALGRDVGERQYGTLACEIWAYCAGADIVRTHQVRALSDAMKMVESIIKYKNGGDR